MLYRLSYDRNLAHCRNGHDLDPSGHRFEFCVRRMNAAITRKPSRRVPKELLVVRERLQPLSMLVRMRENLIAGDNPSFNFVEFDLPTKLYWSTSLVARDNTRLRRNRD